MIEGIALFEIGNQVREHGGPLARAFRDMEAGRALGQREPDGP